MRIIIFLILISLQISVFASDYKPLIGHYKIGGKTLYDPPENESKGTHIYIELNGVNAKELFHSMKAPEVKDICMDDGSITKRIKEMQCTRFLGGKEYRCWFGIDLKNQRITGGVIC